MGKQVRLWTSECTRNKLKSDAAKLGMTLTQYMDNIANVNKEQYEKKKLYRKFP